MHEEWRQQRTIRNQYVFIVVYLCEYLHHIHKRRINFDFRKKNTYKSSERMIKFGYFVIYCCRCNVVVVSPWLFQSMLLVFTIFSALFLIKMRLILICSFFSLFSSLIDVIVSVKKNAFLFCRYFFWLEIFRFVGGCAVRMVSTESNKWGKKNQKKNSSKKPTKKKTDNRLMNYSENTQNYMVS